MSSKKSLLSSIGLMAVLMISSKLVRLVILMITARFLTPEDFGVVAAFTMVYAFSYLLADFGILRTVIQRPKLNDKHIGSSLFISVFLSFIIFFILYVFNLNIAEFMTVLDIAKPLKMSAFMFIVLGVTNICSAIIQRNGEVVFIGKVQAIGTLLGNIFVTIPLALLEFGYWSIIIGLWVTEIFSLVFIFIKGKQYLQYKMYKHESLEVIKYSTAFFFNNSLSMFSQQIDTAFVSRYMGGAELGNYSRAMQLVEFPNQIYIMVVDRVIFPVMSSMKSQKYKLSEFFIESFSILSLIFTVGTVIIFLSANEIVSIMMGEQWLIVVDLLKILAVSIYFRALSSFMDSYLAAYDLVKVLTIKQISVLCVLVLGIWLGISHGINGVAFSVVISSGFRFIITLGIVIKYTSVSIVTILKNLIASITTFLFFVITYFFLSQYEILIGGSGVILALLVYVFLSLVKPSSIFLSKWGEEMITNLRKKVISL